MLSKIFKVLFALVILLIIALTYALNRIGPTGSGYAAKITCSCTFLADRDYESIFAVELGGRSYISVGIDRENQRVTARTLGMFERTAVYREGLGCTLLQEGSEEELRNQVAQEKLLKAPDSLAAQAWPMGDSMGPIALPPEVDASKFEEAMNWAFAEEDPTYPRHTRALLVVHRGKLIAERYAEGFGPETLQMGWSMSKGITQALIGILVQQGKLDHMAKAPIDAWQESGDPRAEITTDQLLRMSSGLEFDEEYSLLGSDATIMLFQKPDVASYAINKPLAQEPDSHWYYSSGTTNILQTIIRKQFAQHIDYLNFPRESLFHKIGMRSAIIEPDQAGTLVGSSFGYATPRDWARFGMLYAHDGVWNGERILPEGWLDYTCAASPNAPNGRYGGQFWLNAGVDEAGSDRRFPKLPQDFYYCSGYEFQRVAVIPSKDLVIVRLGVKTNTKDQVKEDAYHETLFANFLAAFEE